MSPQNQETPPPLFIFGNILFFLFFAMTLIYMALGWAFSWEMTTFWKWFFTIPMGIGFVCIGIATFISVVGHWIENKGHE